MKEVKVLIAEYIAKLKLKVGISNPTTLSEITNTAEGTLKNLCSAKTDNPGISTVAQVVYSLGGSLDEMFNQDKNKEELKEVSVLAIKELYEQQQELFNATNEKHIENIRSHYEQHHEDLKENYERRLADKRELIETKDSHIKTLERECFSYKVFSWICVLVLVVLLIAEVMNPNLGWLRY